MWGAFVLSGTAPFRHFAVGGAALGEIVAGGSIILCSEGAALSDGAAIGGSVALAAAVGEGDSIGPIAAGGEAIALGVDGGDGAALGDGGTGGVAFPAAGGGVFNAASASTRSQVPVCGWNSSMNSRLWDAASRQTSKKLRTFILGTSTGGMSCNASATSRPCFQRVFGNW